MATIKVTISKSTGKAELLVDGAKGASCLTLTKVLREAAQAESSLKRTKDFDRETDIVQNLSI